MIPGTYTIPAIVRGDYWPGFGPVQILVNSGAAISAVANATTDTLTAAAHGLTDDSIVHVAATAGGLTLGVRYHVINAATNTLKLSATSGGSAVNLSANSTHSLQLAAPPTAALAHARIQFRRESETGTVGLEITDEDATDPLSIDDADTWTMTIPSRTAPSRAGLYYWDLETEDEDGKIKTYLKGTWEIQQDATRVA